MLRIKSLNCNSTFIKKCIYFLTIFTAYSTQILARDTIETFPSTPYDRFIVYQTLVIFWIAIIGLIVIVKMKLREIVRIQNMGINKEEKDIPFLD